MKNPSIVNLFYSLFIMAVGLFSFILRFESYGDFQFTALIPFIFGTILLFFTNGMKKENKLISHLAVVLTSLLALTTTILFIINLGSGFIFSRKEIIFLLIIISSYIVLTLYMIRFIKVRKEKL